LLPFGLQTVSSSTSLFSFIDLLQTHFSVPQSGVLKKSLHFIPMHSSGVFPPSEAPALLIKVRLKSLSISKTGADRLTRLLTSLSAYSVESFRDFVAEFRAVEISPNSSLVSTL
jgi:hypothetical protein